MDDAQPESSKASFRKTPNLADYVKARQTFDWKNIESLFDWSKTGKVNMAHEAIDRHCDTGRTAWRSIT
jgi:hypothetical protein